MSRRKRILVSLGILAVVGIIYFWLFGIQTIFVVGAHNAARKLPFLNRTPVALTDLSISQAPGTKLSYFGYEFEMPWTDIDNEKIKIVGRNKVIIPFHSGNAFMMWSAPPHEFVNNVVEKMKLDRESFQKIYGAEVLQSDYSFMRLILDTTPSKITVSSTRERDVSQETLLMLKGMSLSLYGDPESGIFDVSGREFNGFQYGSPQSPSGRINVELFPNGGHLDLFFGEKKDGGTPITQADINRVVLTIHKVSAEVTVSR
jgi:hypothetical protein